MSVQINIIDTATPHFRRLQQDAPNEFRRAMKSAGWWLRERVKEGIQAQAPAGQPWESMSAVTTHQRLRHKGQRKKKYSPLGRLKQANAYKWYGDSMRVKVGWISRSAESLGLKHERGHETRVTPRMRRFYWAAGVPLSRETRTLKIPKRTTFDPIYRRYGPEVPRYLDSKVRGFLADSERRR